jgi:GT2 family glycosyltransferase
VLLANPQVGAAGARIVSASDGADQDYPFRFPSLRGMALRAVRGAEYPAAGKQRPLELERLHGAGMMIRGELLRSVGLLDEGFFMYDEDVDWCTRARASGWALWLVPSSRVLHHGGASSGRQPSGLRSTLEASDGALRMRYELRRSRYRLYRKHRSGWELCALKLATDAVMAAQCMRAAALWIAAPARRPDAKALLRSNLRIIGLNPFSIERAPRGA